MFADIAAAKGRFVLEVSNDLAALVGRTVTAPTQLLFESAGVVR